MQVFGWPVYRLSIAQKHKLAVDINWNNLEENSKIAFVTTLKKWRVCMQKI